MREIEIKLPKLSKLPKFITKFFVKEKSVVKVRKEVRELKHNLETYSEDWKCPSSNLLRHTKTGIELWVGSGMYSLDFWPDLNAFTRAEQKYLWGACTTIMNRNQLEDHSESSDFSKLMHQINKLKGEWNNED